MNGCSLARSDAAVGFLLTIMRGALPPRIPWEFREIFDVTTTRWKPANNVHF
jgi:hypothetical protein